ncbi:pentapeptide repeat-containing protein [Corallococcus interemptor]|uniref:pentapeptide repeat-containing protein n=1 Tax=Corallococcus interemptor TaxID=2316720 RepID=UPI0013158AB7|nr:pentapeptide repeat-containing protein [Corallococcus interemptor]
MPLYIPLRELQRGGISWESLAASLGLAGSAPDAFRCAARAGLVALLLDGLDEVAGRYDPNVVSEVIQLLQKTIATPHARIALSGRTTEAFLLDKEKSLQIGLELPDVESRDFKRYAETVTNIIVPEWPRIASRLPDASYDSLTLGDEPPSESERNAIVTWIQRVFSEFGKDRSLFFVQSLACLARTHQLSGNRPLVINSNVNTDVSIYDICLLAASLACCREQDKIEAIARDKFDASRQLKLLTYFALLASADANLSLRLSRPNAAAQSVFDIDPVNENEEFTAVLRQMQKHALLFASRDGLTTGDWKPAFLSDWIRSVLLVRAWQSETDGLGGASRETLERVVLQARRAGLAFGSIFPDLPIEERTATLAELSVKLASAANEGSPEACANYWHLIVGAKDQDRSTVQARPANIVDLTDLSELEVEGLQLDEHFSANLAFFVASKFTSCSIAGATFSSCDFSGAIFSGCTLTNVCFAHCDGPLFFVDCDFFGCSFEDLRTSHLPAVLFVNCTFNGGKISQNSHPSSPSAYGSAIEFYDCITTSSPAEFLCGEWLGIDVNQVDGLIHAEDRTRGSPAEECLRRLLRPFFPSRVGSRGEIQARRYIRLSAIGRGVFPNGSPDSSRLQEALLSVGFTPGGRSDHLYAPWSGVAGASEAGFALRNEMIAFIRTGKRSPKIDSLLQRIDRDSEW